MKKTSFFLIGMTSVLLAFGMTGCDDIVSGAKKAETDAARERTLVLNGAAAGARYTAAVYDYKERVEAQNYAAWSETATTLGGGEAASAGSPASVKLATYNESAVFSDGPYLVKITEKNGTAETAKYSSAVPFGASSVTLSWSTMTVIPPAKTADVGSVVYAGTTANGEPMELVITGSAASLNISANVAGQPVYAVYTPRTGDTYVIKVSGVVISKGIVTVTADAPWEFKSESSTFTAIVKEDSLKFEGKITDGIDGNSIPELILTKDAVSGYTLTLAKATDGQIYAAELYSNGDAAGGGEATAAGGSAVIKLSPYNGKPAFTGGTYTVRITAGASAKEAAYVEFVAGGNTQLDWEKMPERIEAEYRVSLSVAGDFVFSPKAASYTEGETLTVTITNTGNRPTGYLKVVISDPVAFTLSPGSISDIAEGEKREKAFSIRPNSGLKAGIYTATVTVSGDNDISAGFSVSFTVNEPSDPENAFTSLPPALAYLDAHTGGSTDTNPVLLKMKVNLASSTDGWAPLVNALASRNKYVALDLSSCSMSGTEFDLYAGAVAGKNYIVSLILPDSATSIASSSFDNSTPNDGRYYNNSYTKLRTVSGANVLYIGSHAFSGCSSLATVSFPKVTTIGSNGVFYWCTSLTTVSFPEATSIGAGAFSCCTSLTAASFPKATSIGDLAFYGCMSLTAASIPEATSIGDSTFMGCTSLTAASFPKATSIWVHAFRGCTSLSTVSFPEATSIGDVAFYGCTSLTAASIPEATSIGDSAFMGCTSLTAASFPKATSIGEVAFRGCTSLSTVSFPEVESIGAQAFLSCTSLTTASVPKVTSIGNYAFLSCTALTTVSFPEVESIGEQAFYGCTSLTTASFPKVTVILTHAFAYSGTTPLTITMGTVAPTVGANIFGAVTATKTVTIRVPSGATGYGEAWQEAFKGYGNDGSEHGTVNSYINLVIQYEGQSAPAPIDPEDGFTSLPPALAYLDAHTGGTTANPVLLKLNLNLASSTDGWVALSNALASRTKYIALDLSACSMNGTAFDLYAGTIAGKNYIVSLILPDSATSIASSSLDNTTYTSSGHYNNSYSKLRTVSGANVINIGDWAFSWCTSLTTVSFPEATGIGDSAFTGCTSLTSVSAPKATSIGSYVFDGCTSLTTVSFPEATGIGIRAFCYCTSLSTVSFPAVTSIGSTAFASCTSLTTASFPEATSVGDSAFNGCTSLTTMSFPKVTSIEGGAFAGCDALTEVSFPEATGIGAAAFTNCDALTEVSFPEATSIGAQAFSYCDALTEVSFPEVKSIEYSAFNGCTSLTTVDFPKATTIMNGHSYSITDSSDSYVYYGVFIGCTALTSVSVPKVTNIGDYAFHSSGTTPLTITMGAIAPPVGLNIFLQVTSTKNVTVRVPNGATGYDEAWQEAFKGYGSGTPHGTENTYINVVVEYY